MKLFQTNHSLLIVNFHCGKKTKTVRLLEENPGGDITVLPGLVPSLADDTALGTAEETALFITGDGGHGSGDSGHGGTGLYKKCIPIFITISFFQYPTDRLPIHQSIKTISISFGLSKIYLQQRKKRERWRRQQCRGRGRWRGLAC